MSQKIEWDNVFVSQSAVCIRRVKDRRRLHWKLTTKPCRQMISNIKYRNNQNITSPPCLVLSWRRHGASEARSLHLVRSNCHSFTILRPQTYIATSHQLSTPPPAPHRTMHSVVKHVEPWSWHDVSIITHRTRTGTRYTALQPTHI